MSDFDRPRPTATALLVIDVQESFRQRPYFRADDLPAYFAAQNLLIEGFARLRLPVVRVLHVEPDGPFSLASGLVRPMAELAAFDPALRFEKHAHSAMSGTPLQSWLTGRGIARIAVSGIRTEQCCETTTRDASDRGFQVDYVGQATLTFPMRHPSTGREFGPDEIRERTELVLAGRFAALASPDEAIARARAALEAAGAVHAPAA
ncbi:MAG TPA: isochorismatase family protein [Kofleriaceae bacterium]|nr:isochorismatase family protein [Kofleriaceae bacterium]